MPSSPPEKEVEAGMPCENMCGEMNEIGYLCAPCYFRFTRIKTKRSDQHGRPSMVVGNKGSQKVIDFSGAAGSKGAQNYLGKLEAVGTQGVHRYCILNKCKFRNFRDSLCMVHYFKYSSLMSDFCDGLDDEAGDDDEEEEEEEEPLEKKLSPVQEADKEEDKKEGEGEGKGGNQGGVVPPKKPVKPKRKKRPGQQARLSQRLRRSVSRRSTRRARAISKAHAPTNKNQVSESEKKKKVRETAAEEFLSTEKTFVDGLDIITRVYLKRLQKAIELGKPYISASDIVSIFNNVEQILNVNRKFYGELCDAKSRDCLTEELPGILLQFSPYFKMYQSYVNGFEDACGHMSECVKKISSFEFFLNLNNACEGMSLDSFLIMPVQRLPRYKMLLEVMIKHNPEDPDSKVNKQLKEALEAVMKVAMEINNRLQANAKRSMVLEVQNRLKKDDRYVDLVTPTRYLIKEGRVQRRFQTTGRVQSRLQKIVKLRGVKLRGEWQNCQLFLFNDSVVYTSCPNAMSRTYQLKAILALHSLEVTDSGGKQFKLSGWRKTLEFSCDSEQDKDEWIAELIDQIPLAKDEQDVLSSRTIMRSNQSMDISGDMFSSLDPEQMPSVASERMPSVASIQISKTTGSLPNLSSLGSLDPPSSPRESAPVGAGRLTPATPATTAIRRGASLPVVTRQDSPPMPGSPPNQRAPPPPKMSHLRNFSVPPPLPRGEMSHKKAISLGCIPIPASPSATKTMNPLMDEGEGAIFEDAEWGSDEEDSDGTIEEEFSKDHWVDNALVSACFCCSKPFTFARRRHHCRSCGNVVCRKCSSHKTDLGNKMRRTCNTCYEYNLNPEI